MTRGAGGRRPQVPGLPRRVPAHGARCKCGQNGNSPFHCFQMALRLSRCSEADGKLDFLEPPQGCVRAIERPPGVCPPHMWFTDVLVTFLPGTGAAQSWLPGGTAGTHTHLWEADLSSVLRSLGVRELGPYILPHGPGTLSAGGSVWGQELTGGSTRGTPDQWEQTLALRHPGVASSCRWCRRAGQFMWTEGAHVCPRSAGTHRSQGIRPRQPHGCQHTLAEFTQTRPQGECVRSWWVLAGTLSPCGPGRWTPTK